MDIFIQQVVSGLATGGIYASLALALVMIYQATDVVNFAQGEMAMFSTYLAWSMLQAGLPYWVAFLATTGVILSASYALWLYRRVIFGALEKESLKSLLDLSGREKALLYPLVILTIFFGVYPAPVFDVTAASVDALLNQYSAALQAAQSVALTAN